MPPNRGEILGSMRPSSSQIVDPTGKHTMKQPRNTKGHVVLMNKAGLSSLEVIKAATSKAAQALGLEKEIGKIAPGCYADLIAMPNNPLEDVSTFKDVDWVMHNGKIVRDDYGGKSI